METLQYIIVGVLPIVGVVIGATLQYLFSISSEQRKHQQDLKTQAYVDFIRSSWMRILKERKKNTCLALQMQPQELLFMDIKR